MLRFRKLLIPGTGSHVSFASPRAANKRIHHWGTKGDTEVRGLLGGRELRAVMWIHDPKWLSENKVWQFLDKLSDEINKHGSLQLLDRTKKVKTTFKLVTFDEWRAGGGTPDGIPMAPIPDIGRTLEPGIKATETAWWMEIHLRFYQLHVLPQKYAATP